MSDYGHGAMSETEWWEVLAIVLLFWIVGLWVVSTIISWIDMAVDRERYTLRDHIVTQLNFIKKLRLW